MEENKRVLLDHEHPETVPLLPEDEIQRAARFLRVLGDPTKLKIVCALAGDGETREICAGTIAASLGMTKSAVSHQLRILREEGMIRCRKEGKHVIYALDDEHVARAVLVTVEHIRHRASASSHTKSQE